MCSSQRGELTIRSWEVKGLRYEIMRPCFGLKKVFACCRHVIILSLLGDLQSTQEAGVSFTSCSE